LKNQQHSVWFNIINPSNALKVIYYFSPDVSK